MTLFKVWAPRAGERVDVAIGDARFPMTRAERGWWSAEVPDAGPGTDYAFSVDASEPLPDPRSHWQPCGVHGPSRIVNHAVFEWTDHNWQPHPLQSAVIYEVHVGTFSPEGTFEGAVGRLDHLVGLGVTHIKIMPVMEFSGQRGWGYDGVHIYAPQHSYGGPDGFKRLVAACHARGLGVILDVVYNHFGPEGNHTGRFGHYFTARHRTPWGEAINFDGAGSDEVRRFMIDNAVMWLEDYHVDGLRLDAVHTIIDISAVHILEQLAREVADLSARLGRYMFVIAESDLNDPRLVWRWEVGGYGIDAQWSDDFHHAIHAILTGENTGYYAPFGRMEHLAKAFEKAFVFDGAYSVYRDRCHGRSTVGTTGHQYLGYLQNHDQVGNRAMGDRIAQTAGHRRQMVGAALVFASPFVPMIFQGEEWAASTPFQYFCDFEDPALRKAVSEGRRKDFAAFGWRPEDVADPEDPASFERSRLVWDELAREPHASMLDWYRRLIALRRASADLSNGHMHETVSRFDEEERWIVVERGRSTIAANLSEIARTVSLKTGRVTNLLLASDADIRVRPEEIDLPPDSVAILGPATG